VATRISRLGTSSAELVAAIFKRGSDGLILSSHAVTVWFDYEKQAGTPIPATVRSSIKRFEKTAPDESVSSLK
jgi:acyl-CoA thioesterase FadM